MNTCEARICRFYRNLPPGTLFTTSDCLDYGSRDDVDHVLFKLVKKGELVRLTSGVFTCAFKGNLTPAAFELATVKARAFGKQIRLDNTAASDTAFMVNGCSSSFKSKHLDITVAMRAACAKKMQR